MGECPFHDGDDGGAKPDADGAGQAHGWGRGGGIDRRAFVKSAVAIGGVSALGSLVSVETAAADVDTLPYPTGDPTTRPERQHAWSPVGTTDEFGNPAPPSHQLVLLLDYEGEDLEADADAMEAAFRGLEDAFTYDVGEGLVFTVGYSPAYFKRHRGGVPGGVDITEPRPISPHFEPELDRQDVFVHLASDEATIVLAAEEALLGDLESVNGVSVEASLADAFTVDERRSVFVGAGQPAERIDTDAIDEDAPLSMGFDSAFTDTIPPEEAVTIDEGPWAGGTVAQVSKLRLELDDWYDKDREERVEEMFAPAYSPTDVGDGGEGLGEGSGRAAGDGWDEAVTDDLETDAEERGVVGHGQKVTRARDDDFVPKLLRRDGNITVDGGDGGLSFVGLVEGIADWIDVAESMYDVEVDELLRQHDAVRVDDRGPGSGSGQTGRPPSDEGSDHHPRSGIAAEMDVRARGNFLIPPRSLRALPETDP